MLTSPRTSTFIFFYFWRTSTQHLRHHRNTLLQHRTVLLITDERKSSTFLSVATVKPLLCPPSSPTNSLKEPSPMISFHHSPYNANHYKWRLRWVLISLRYFFLFRLILSLHYVRLLLWIIVAESFKRIFFFFWFWLTTYTSESVHDADIVSTNLSIWSHIFLWTGFELFVLNLRKKEFLSSYSVICWEIEEWDVMLVCQMPPFYWSLFKYVKSWNKYEEELCIA